MNGGRSWYHGREFGGPRPIGVRGQEPRFGMRDGFNRGDYGRGKTFGNLNRQSSTRTTVTRDHSFGNSRQNNATFGSGVRGGGSFGGYNRSGFGSGSTNNSRSFNNGFTPRSSTPNRGSFGGNRGGNSLNNSRSFNSGSRSFGGGNNGARSSFGGGSFRSKSNNGGGSFGGRR